jgi:hypothetical protein
MHGGVLCWCGLPLVQPLHASAHTTIETALRVHMHASSVGMLLSQALCPLLPGFVLVSTRVISCCDRAHCKPKPDAIPLCFTYELRLTPFACFHACMHACRQPPKAHVGALLIRGTQTWTAACLLWCVVCATPHKCCCKQPSHYIVTSKPAQHIDEPCTHLPYTQTKQLLHHKTPPFRHTRSLPTDHSCLGECGQNPHKSQYPANRHTDRHTTGCDCRRHTEQTTTLGAKRMSMNAHMSGNLFFFCVFVSCRCKL